MKYSILGNLAQGDKKVYLELTPHEVNAIISAICFTKQIEKEFAQSILGKIETQVGHLI